MCEMSDPKQTLATGNYLALIRDEGWEYVIRTRASGVVAIVAVTGADELILVEQYRKAVAAPVLELPAGLVGDEAGQEQESEAEAARRELEEETGYTASEMTLLMKGPPSAGLGTEIVSIYRAAGLKQIGQGGGTDDEDITVHRVPLSGAERWLQAQEQRGCLTDPKVYVGLYFAARK